jgi:hypothetical protein
MKKTQQEKLLVVDELFLKEEYSLAVAYMFTNKIDIKLYIRKWILSFMEETMDEKSINIAFSFAKEIHGIRIIFDFALSIHNSKSRKCLVGVCNKTCLVMNLKAFIPITNIINKQECYALSENETDKNRIYSYNRNMKKTYNQLEYIINKITRLITTGKWK